MSCVPVGWIVLVQANRQLVLNLIKSGLRFLWTDMQSLLQDGELSHRLMKQSHLLKGTASFKPIACNNVRFEVLTAVFLRFQVLWDVMLCHWVTGSLHFGEHNALIWMGQAVVSDVVKMLLLFTSLWTTFPKHSITPGRSGCLLRYACWFQWPHSLNPSAWSDKHCSSCCTLSLIRLYLDNIRRKCNQAALYVFMKVLALVWCGRQFLQIMASFFLSSRSLGFLFAVPNFTVGFMRLWNEEMKYETNVIAIVT